MADPCLLIGDIVGGIVKRYPELIANSRFRTGFERKGRHRS